jgi:tungstate transport system substrate-binding protein
MRSLARRLAACVVPLVLAAACGCGGSETPTITLATTTSTQDSGLLDDLLPRFREKTGIEVKVIALGSGQALRMGRDGEADVLLTHDPAGEERFMAEGHGSLRRRVMHNDFVVVGPPSDPARIKGSKAAAEAFARVARHAATFVSRSDGSGTHQKEKEVWKQAGIEPRGDWYLKAGAGMLQVLRVADEKGAYALTDRGTYLAHREKLRLNVVCEGDPELENRYSVLLVNPEKHPHARADAARKFVDFLVSPEGQEAIRSFGAARFGRPLFYPDARD